MSGAERRKIVSVCLVAGSRYLISLGPSRFQCVQSGKWSRSLKKLELRTQLNMIVRSDLSPFGGPTTMPGRYFWRYHIVEMGQQSSVL